MNNNIHRDFSSIEELVWDEDFRQWVLDRDEDLDEYWNNWLAIHQDRTEEVLTAKQIVKAMSVKESAVSDMEIALSIKNIFSKIDQSPPQALTPVKINRNWLKITGIAASLLAIIGLTTLFIIKNNSSSPVTYKDQVREAENQLIEKANTSIQPKQVLLADGSKITLQKNTRISFAPAFNSFTTRKVYLTGKATFEVAKNPAKPFFVYTNGFITKVLGTKFTITSNERDKNATVEVISGIVSVFSLVDKQSQDEVNTRKLNSLILTRNQKASFARNERTLIASVVERPAALNEKVFDVAFTDAPLKTIFKTIEDSYGIEIIYDEKALANRTLTADMSKTTMYEKLNIICKTINAGYEIIDGKIVISTNGATQ